MRSADLVPVIGGPLHNLQFYILDAQLQPLPVGVAGELYIGGAGVARGYLNRPALTAEKFVPDPFSGVAQRQPGARLYRSGDLARYLPDGNIEYLGRIDNQIKLRGYRIELGEIEAVLRQQPAVQDAAVALHEDAPGDARLVAYVTAAAPDDHGEPSARDEQLHTALAERLPAYTLPTAYIWLATLPLLPSGKVDRRSLPQPERRRIERSFSPPRTPLEQAIAQVWSDTLGVTPIGIDDNFFALGGHSLTAMRLMAQIERRVGVSLPLTALLQGGTVAELAAAIQQRQGAAPFQALVPIQPSGSQPPFFCIHPAGGDVLCYRELAVQLGATQPFYGLQAAGIYGEQAPDGTIEALAARYLAALQTQQPEGPYYLGGWSVGGVVAVELARQLQERGQAVAALVLIDSQPADATDRAESQLDLLASFAAQIGLNLDQLAFLRDDLEALPPEERIGFALTQLRRTAILPADLSADDLTNRFRVFEAHVLAMQHYRPRQLSGAMTLIQAAERDSDAAAAAAAWSRQIDELTVHSVPGDHLTMLRAPHVATLARVLSGCLAQAALEIASEQRSAR
jgi:thioesterase domain-containing protein/acyl carrier protein